MKKLNIRRFDVGGGFQIDSRYTENYDQNGNCISVTILVIASENIARVEDNNGNDISSQWGSFPSDIASKTYTENLTERVTFISSGGEEISGTIDIFSVDTTPIYEVASDANIKLNSDIKINNLTLGEMDSKLAALFDLIYPTGSIYYTTNANFNPNISFSGTWVQIKDTFLLAAGDTYVGGTSGGRATVQLSVNQLPKVSGSWSIHAQEGGTEWYGKSGYATGTVYNNYRTLMSQTPSSGATSLQNPGFAFGNNEAHENMPPYIVVYVWKRTN